MTYEVEFLENIEKVLGSDTSSRSFAVALDNIEIINIGNKVEIKKEVKRSFLSMLASFNGVNDIRFCIGNTNISGLIKRAGNDAKIFLD